MAVVTRYTKGYPDPTALSAYKSNAHEARQNVKVAFFKIAVVSGDSIASVYKLARIPSWATVLPNSIIYTSGITSLAANIGINNREGTKAAAALASAVSLSSAGNAAINSAVAAANYDQRLWQLLGLASDPKADLDIEATLTAAAGAAGTLTGFIYWVAAGF